MNFLTLRGQTGHAALGGSTLVAMVQTANFREGNDIAGRTRLYGTRPRFLVDFITNMCGFRFLVHTGHFRPIQPVGLRVDVRFATKATLDCLIIVWRAIREIERIPQGICHCSHI